MAARISPQSVRGLAQPFLRSAVRMGLTNAEAYGQLQIAGLDYAPTTFAKDMASLRAGPTPRAVPFGSVSSRVSFSPQQARILSRGPQRYQYLFSAQLRNEAGQFTSQVKYWSFTSSSLLIPDIAAGIGLAQIPDLSSERYAGVAPEGTLPISPNDVYMFTDPYQLGTFE